MCQGGSTTTTQKLPEWVEKAGQDIYGSAKNFYSQGYQPYQGQRVANASGDTYQGYQAVRDWNNGTGGPASVGQQDVNTQTVGTQRIATPQRSYENIQNYINPYTEGTLNPTIRNVNEQAARSNQQIGAAANAAGAFGDARQGVRENAVGRDANQQISDATYKAYSDAYTQGLAASGADIDRRTNADIKNADLAQASGFKNADLAASADTQNAALAETYATRSAKEYQDMLGALFGIGQNQEQRTQNVLDSQYQAYTSEQQDAYDRLAALVSVMQGVPYGRAQTSSKNESGTSAATSLLGSLFGKMFGLGS